MKGTMTREQVNAAVWKVMTSQFKKEVKQEHKMVEDAGYTIEKYNGDWWIKNPETKRKIRLVHSSRFNQCYLERSGNGQRIAVRPWEAEEMRKLATKFDFVGFLDKPENRAWREVQNQKMWGTCSKAYERYETLKHARWIVDYEEKRLEDIEKQMQKLQAEMISLQKETVRATEARIKAQQVLAECKKELGLVK